MPQERLVTRRQLLRIAGRGVVGLAGLPLLAACSSSPPASPAPTTAPAGGAASTPAAATATQGPAASSGQKMQLRILQWSHFVPAWDKWYDQFAKDWGAKNNVDVSVDHMPTAEMPARLAAEVAAKAGHDLIEMNGQILTYRYTDQMADVGDIVDYAVKKWGEVEPIGKKLGNIGGKWVGVPHYYIMITPFVRTDLFQEAGYDWQKVETWDQYREVGAKLKANKHAAGLAISHCNDANHNWRAIMWCFGASEVAEDGKTVTIDTPEMREFLKFAKAFYTEANTPEVFAWDDASDNRWLASGVGGYIHDALSSYRSIEGQNKELFEKLAIAHVVKGPKAQIAMPDSNIFSIWNFAPKQNQEAAKAFLKYLFDNYKEDFVQSTGYNMPMYANLFQKPMPILGEDPHLQIVQDYRGSLLDTFGHPGPPTTEATLVLNNYIIPDMVGIAVRGATEDSVGDAINWAKDQLSRIYK
jgi:multiple sugar transport system substrate-binding protein